MITPTPFQRSHRDYQFPQTITVWRQDGIPDVTGQRGWTRRVLKARYQSVNRLYVREDGESVRSLAYVYTKEDSLQIGDRVALGEFTNSSPSTVKGAYDIKQRRVITNMRGTRSEFRYIQ